MNVEDAIKVVELLGAAESANWRSNAVVYSVYVTLVTRAHSNVCELTTARIAEINGISRQSVRTAINTLVSSNAIEVNARKGRGNAMKIRIVDTNKKTAVKAKKKKTKKDEPGLCYFADWSPTDAEYDQYVAYCEDDHDYLARQADAMKAHFIDGKGRNEKRKGWHRTVLTWLRNARERYNDLPRKKSDADLIEEVRREFEQRQLELINSEIIQ